MGGRSPLAAFLCSFPPGVALTWSSGGEGSPLAFSLNLRNEQPGEPLGSHAQKPGRQAAEGPEVGVKAPRRVAPRSGGSRRCTERVSSRFSSVPKASGHLYFCGSGPGAQETGCNSDAPALPRWQRWEAFSPSYLPCAFMHVLSSQRRGGAGRVGCK